MSYSHILGIPHWQDLEVPLNHIGSTRLFHLVTPHLRTLLLNPHEYRTGSPTACVGVLGARFRIHELVLLFLEEYIFDRLGRRLTEALLPKHANLRGLYFLSLTFLNQF